MKQNLINIFKHTANVVLIGVWLFEATVLIFDIACILQPQSKLPYPGFANLTLFQNSVWLLNTYIVLFCAITVTCIFVALNYVRRDILMAILVTLIPMIINVITFYINM